MFPSTLTSRRRGYAVAEGQRVREHHLPCCGLGLGWCLFILGLFLGGIPWYVAAVLMIFTRRTMDYREKPGYIVCTVASLMEEYVNLCTCIYFGDSRWASIWQRQLILISKGSTFRHLLEEFIFSLCSFSFC